MSRNLLLASALLICLIRGQAALGQTNLREYNRGIELQQQEMADRAAASAQKRAMNAQKRFFQAMLKEQQAHVGQLTTDQLKRWQKQNGPIGQFYRYEIMRNNAVMGVAIFHPKLGYVVDDKFQTNGRPWTTLDAAMHRRFTKHELATLSEIPGWANSDKLTQEEHMADLKSRTLEQAKPKAVEKMSDIVANDIVTGAGPTIQNNVAGELGIQATPPQRNLKFKRIKEDDEAITYGNTGNTFLIVKQKKGEIFELVRQKNGKPVQKYDEVFSTLKEAVDFASEQK